MTISRESGSLEAALLDTARALSEQSIRQYTGKSANYFYKASNPNNTEQLSAFDAAALDAAREREGHPRTLVPKLLKLTDTLLNGHAAPATCIKTSLLETAVRHGELARSVRQAMEDGVLDPHECREIEQRCQALKDELSAIQQACKPRKPGEVA